MNKKPSEIIREKILQNGGRAIVHSLTGKPYEIRHGSDGKSFLCDQLPIKPPYTYDVFDVIVDLLERQGGKADKGAGRNAKLGQPRCEETTVVGAIAKYYAGNAMENLFSIPCLQWLPFCNGQTLHITNVDIWN